MQVYIPSVESDVLLLNWYMEMANSDDFENTFSAELAPCSAFMTSMAKSFVLYEVDEQGLWAVCWFDRVMCAGAFGLWVRADKRHQAATLEFIINALDAGLEKFPVLLCVTRQQPVIDQAVRLGFTAMGKIPWLFDGDAAHIAYGDRASTLAIFTEIRERLHPPIVDEVAHG